MERGFTLFELLIAMALTAVMGTVMFKTWDMVVSSGLKAKEVVNKRELERTVLNIMDNDMAAIQLPGDELSLLPMPSRRPIEPTANYFKLLGRRKSGKDEKNIVRLISFASGSSLKAEGAPTGFPVCVEYVLKSADNGDKRLFRRERDFCGVNGDYPWREALLMDKLEDARLELEMRDGSRLDNWAREDILAQPHAIRFSWRKKDAEKEEEHIFPFPERKLEIGWEKEQ